MVTCIQSSRHGSPGWYVASDDVHQPVVAIRAQSVGQFVVARATDVVLLVWTYWGCREPIQAQDFSIHRQRHIGKRVFLLPQ